MIDKAFWQGKKIFLTGHTGFKGSWLCIWLHSLGANVTGYALTPPTKPNLFEICNVQHLITSVIGDVRDYAKLEQTLQQAQPDIVIHMAAQPLVRDSYKNPVDTYAINVMGTVHLLEAVRHCKSVKAIVNVTTDKCYENKEWVWGYRENEPMGGYDPYSNSKGCSELVTASYRNSFFNPTEYQKHGVGLASARAGNVIGGGDWAAERLIPDCIDALLHDSKVIIRNPFAIRPWQHVLEPLSGYLLLAQRLYEDGACFSEGWNFGPNDHDAKPVEWIVQKICEEWGKNAAYEIDKSIQPHEAHYLKLDCSKAKSKLNWQPRWDLQCTLGKIVEWVRAYEEKSNMREVCLKQIEAYMRTVASEGK
ncbi:MAG: CDP-glucose 4,6-dehydratase [Anaerocolumna sp.]|jgi:CDP-glucose 4,6-dehydratase|nr:CDP-glucose 4,6-dehydratase [Anaerocolumna sp.]